MAANKPQSKSKGKPTAKQHAQNRAQAQIQAGETPKVPISETHRSQGRFPGETPLTGEDRPADQLPPRKQGRSHRDKT